MITGVFPATDPVMDTAYQTLLGQNWIFVIFDSAPDADRSEMPRTPEGSRPFAAPTLVRFSYSAGPQGTEAKEDDPLTAALKEEADRGIF